jgi:hypothetical protein
MRLTKTVGLARVIMIAACVFGRAPAAHGQGVEIAPFGGYRFGGDFFELVTGRPVDVDGAPAVGVVVDVPLWEGLQVEGLFTHQDATITTPPGPFGGPTRWNISVDHWQGGGLQEFGGPQVRPFLTGVLGLTRYATEGDSEIRFTIGAGGGVKLFPTPHAGVRLDGRLFATFVDADARAFACSPTAGCLTALAVEVVWQAEFTAGIVLKFD